MIVSFPDQNKYARLSSFRAQVTVQLQHSLLNSEGSKPRENPTKHRTCHQAKMQSSSCFQNFRSTGCHAHCLQFKFSTPSTAHLREECRVLFWKRNTAGKAKRGVSFDAKAG